MAFRLGKCRLCLKLGDFYSIFTEDNAIQLADMAMAISEIKIADGDGLPDKVCAECIAKLSAAYIFKQQCERSDQELRRNYVPPPGFQTPTPTPPPSTNRQSSDSGFSTKTEISVKGQYTSTPEARVSRKRSFTQNSNESTNLELSHIKTSPSKTKKGRIEQDRESQSDFSSKKTSNDRDTELQSDSYAKKTRIEQDRDSQSDFDTTKNTRREQDRDSQSDFDTTKKTRSEQDADTESQSDFDNDDTYIPFSSTVTEESDSNEPLISDKNKCDVCEKVLPTVRALASHKNLHKRNLETKPAKKTPEPKSKSSKKHNLTQNKKADSPKKTSDPPKKPSEPPDMVILDLENLKKEALNSDVFVSIPKIEELSEYACSKCGRVFKLKIMLNRHFEKCDIGEEIEIKMEINEIPIKEQVVEEEKKFPAIPCVFCDFSSCTYDDYVKHFEQCKNKPSKMAKSHTVICKPCKFPYNGKHTLFQHLMKVHFPKKKKEEKFECSICSKHLKSQSELVKHLAAHMSNLDEVDMAPDESRASTIEDDRSQSSEHSSQSKESICPHCDKVFTYSKSLQTHMLIKHPGMPVMKVPPLTIKLPQPAAEVYYDEDDEDSPAEELTCNICDKMFSYKRLYEQHKKKHNIASGAKRSKVVFKNCEVECLLCQVTFTAEEAVAHNKQHIMQKLKPRNVYKCSACEMRYKGSQALRTHITLVHRLNQSMPEMSSAVGEINPADFCEVVVAKQEPTDNDNQVKAPLEVIPAPPSEPISGAPPPVYGEFPCPHCGKVLSKKSTYNHHTAWCRTRGVTTAQAIVCSVCEQTFNFKSHYRHHMKQHLTDINLDPEKLTCKICNRRSKHLRALQAHMNWHRQTRFKTDELQCAICKRVFNDRKVYLAHMTKHNKYGESLDLVEMTLNGELPTSGNTCLRCNKVCENQDALKRHMTWHNSKSALFGSRYDCTHCGLQFTNKRSWELHEKTHFESDDGPFKCHICGKGFISDIHFKRHVKGHNFDKCQATLKKKHADDRAKKVKCPLCPRLYPNLPKLLGHLRWMHPKSKMIKMDPDAPTEKAYPCKICAKVFFTERRLLNHETRHLIHKKTPRFVCKFCNRTSLSRKHHNLHIKAHLNSKFKDNPIKCFYCDELFTKGYTLHYHIKDVHGKVEDWLADKKKALESDPKQEYQCAYCLKILASKGNYLRHLDFHSTLKCNYCSEQFNARIFLDGHLEYSCEKRKLVGYSDDYYKLLKCEHCYKAFNLQIKLDCHLKTKHNVDVTKSVRKSSKSIVCDYCFQVFDNEECLDSHKIYHRTIGYYGCIYCKKKFNTMTAYRKHKNHHFAQLCIEDPVKCEHCEETFTEFRAFIYHMKDEHGDDKEWVTMPKEVKSELCKMCNKVFHNLPRHMDYHEQNRCKKCGEYFFSRTAMDQHLCSIESDDDETPAELGLQPAYEECDFCFKPMSKRTKKVHVSKHRVSGSITCRFCNKKFKSVDAFQIHGFSHRSSKYIKKKLKCPECKLKYVKYGPFVKHMREQHKKFHKLYYRAEVLPDKCVVCQNSFPNLHNHYRYHLQAQCLNCKKYFTSDKVFKAHSCGKEDLDPSKVFECSEDLSDLINTYEPKDAEANVKYFADTDEEDEPVEPPKETEGLSSLIISSVHSLKLLKDGKQPEAISNGESSSKTDGAPVKTYENKAKNKEKPTILSSLLAQDNTAGTNPKTKDKEPITKDEERLTNGNEGVKEKPDVVEILDLEEEINFRKFTSSLVTSEIICLDSDED